MSLKKIDPDDSYIVREMFGCGHGHVLPPGFGYWEFGEACTWGHEGPPTDNASYHLYWRLVAVPIVSSKGEDEWKKLCAHPDKWAHLPLAPEGLQEGTRIGERIKLREGEELKVDVAYTEIIYCDSEGRSLAAKKD